MIRRLGFAAALSLLVFPCLAPAQTQADFFDPNVLQRIDITFNPVDWVSLKAHFLDNTKYPANIKWRNITVEGVGIRSRGGGSRSPVKPGLKVEVNHYDPTLRFLGLRNLILRNDVQDASTMRERIAMLLFNKMGETASRESHCRLYVNNEYIGLYTIVESIDEDFLTRNFKEIGDLFKYEYKAGDLPWYFEYRGSNINAYVPKPFKAETNTNFPNTAPIEAWVRTINNSSPSNFQSTAGGVMDVKQFLTHVAIEAALADQDGFLGDFGQNNLYVYRSIAQKVFTFLPWDKSNTFWTIDRYILANATQNQLMKRCMDVPELRTYFLQQAVKAAQILDSFMAQEIEFEYAQIRQAYYDDPNKGCQGADGNVKPCSNAEFEADVNYLRNFAKQRLGIVISQAAASGYSLPTLSASFPTSGLRFGAVTGSTPAAQTVSTSGTNPVNQNFTVALSSGASWLSVSPASGTTPASLTVSIDPGGLSAGDYSATITVTSGAGAGSVVIPVLFSIVPPGSQPIISQGAAVDAADGSGAVLAPGSFISVYGQKMSNDTTGASLPLPTELAGGSIRINGLLAPVVFASPGQMNVQLPWETLAGSATLTAAFKGVASNSITANIGAYSPGIFVTVYPDGTPVDSKKPAGAGDVLIVYANGLGPVSPSVATGKQSPGDTLARTTQIPTVTIGGVNAIVDFSGLTPVLVALYQINVRVPAGVTPGTATKVVVQIGGLSTPPKTITTR